MAKWVSAETIRPHTYRCGYCGNTVGPNVGYYEIDLPKTKAPTGKYLYICSFCQNPTFIHAQAQVPGTAFGNNVDALPADVEALYGEARLCMSVGANTSAVLTCRKVLAHVAVDQGAKPGESFLSYVNYLADKGFVPPHGKGWVDHIRDKGNEANHEIVIMSKDEGERLITFVEMLLKFIYEFPSKVPPPIAPT